MWWTMDACPFGTVQPSAPVQPNCVVLHANIHLCLSGHCLIYDYLVIFVHAISSLQKVFVVEDSTHHHFILSASVIKSAEIFFKAATIFSR